jgi:hypothetical protein
MFVSDVVACLVCVIFEIHTFKCYPNQILAFNPMTMSFLLILPIYLILWFALFVFVNLCIYKVKV